ncbi:MAG: GerW family sporulation protein [Oscillospiraceae bacterium]|nr:GerW family sporulation protein [Oscillospiraceae bacterium]
MEKHTIVELMGASLQKIREMIDVDTVVGKAITTPDGTTIIPVSKVSFGFGAGGSDIPSKHVDHRNENFGGGGGAGAKIVPVAFLIVTDAGVSLVPVAPDSDGGISRVIDAVPGAIDKLIAVLKKLKKDKEGGEAEFDV